MKFCRRCETIFESGLTCPGCHAFVPDLPPDLDLADILSPAPLPTDPRPVATPAPTYPPWAVLADAATGGDADPEVPAEQSVPEPVAETEFVSDAEPEPEPEFVSDAEPEPEPEPEFVSDAEPTDGEIPPPAYPSWARFVEEPTAAEGPSWAIPASTLTGPRATTAALPTVAPPPPAIDARPAPPTGFGIGADSPRRRAIAITPTTIAATVAAVIVIALVGVFVARSSTKPMTAVGDIAPDIVGSCFTYDAGRSRVAAAVPCDKAHDGIVVASVADRADCPAEATSALSAHDDGEAKNGVLCVREET